MNIWGGSYIQRQWQLQGGRMVGKYTEAAHEAYRAVEETGQLFECVHAGNALVYAFLL